MRGRRPRAVPRVRRDLRIREDLCAQVDLLLLDPVRERIGYGKWSDLVERLLSRWVGDQVQGANDPVWFDPYKARVALGMLRQGNMNDLPAAIKLLAEALGETNA